MRARDISKTAFLAGLLAVLFCPAALSQSIIYVDQSATGADNGSSWLDAFIYLQDALAVASAEDEIWVAKGTYTPELGIGLIKGDRTVSFHIPPDIGLFGGFSGFETRRDDRDPTANIVTLSGDLEGDDEIGADPFGDKRDDNSLKVLIISVSTAEPRPTLDGFVISGGNGIENGSSGSGLTIDAGSHANLKNLVFRDNFSCAEGGGLLSHGTFVLEDSRFERNAVGAVSDNPDCRGLNGGALMQWGVFSVGEDPDPAELRRVVFKSNRSTDGGGALTVVERPILVANCSFINNEARHVGGAVYNLATRTSKSVFQNVVFVGNHVVRPTDGIGGAIAIDDSVVDIANALFNGNYVSSPESALGTGGAMAVYESDSDVHVFSSTFVNNSGEFGGAIYRSGESRLTIRNSIFWFNVFGESAEVWPEGGGAIPIGSSIIQSGIQTWHTDLDGNQAVDPLFAAPEGTDGIRGTEDDNYGLTASSPAVNAGDNSSLPKDILDLDLDNDLEEVIPVDLLGSPRLRAESGNETIVDIGAYEYGGTTGRDRPIRPDAFNFGASCSPQLTIFPNPAQDMITVSQARGSRGWKRLILFDPLGRQITTFDSDRVGPPADFVINLSILPQGAYVIGAYFQDPEYHCGLPFIVVR